MARRSRAVPRSFGSRTRLASSVMAASRWSWPGFSLRFKSPEPLHTDDHANHAKQKEDCHGRRLARPTAVHKTAGESLHRPVHWIDRRQPLNARGRHVQRKKRAAHQSENAGRAAGQQLDDARVSQMTRDPKSDAATTAKMVPATGRITLPSRSRARYAYPKAPSRPRRSRPGARRRG